MKSLVVGISLAVGVVCGVSAARSAERCAATRAPLVSMSGGPTRYRIRLSDPERVMDVRSACECVVVRQVSRDEFEALVNESIVTTFVSPGVDVYLRDGEVEWYPL
ncbi:MAG: hypothetical protein HMLKMBBP_01246 [Planctomycetes bacterium]|nr:hypothetical protein [Planctomycetota bacterium]